MKPTCTTCGNAFPCSCLTVGLVTEQETIKWIAHQEKLDENRRKPRGEYRGKR